METTLEFLARTFVPAMLEPDEITGDAGQDADRSLSKTYTPLKVKAGKKPMGMRLGSGWAIVSDAGVVIQQGVVTPGAKRSDETRFKAWLDALERLDGHPILLIEFAKKTVPTRFLARTYDLRTVSICSATGIDTFDLTTEPGPMASMTQRALWNLRKAA
jgi:hypothetical protein